MSSFDTFDWAGSAEWQAIERNLYFSSNDLAEQQRVLLKRKRKFYKANVDPSYEIPDDSAASSSGSSSSSQTSNSGSGSSNSSQPRDVPPRPSSSSPPPSGSSSSSSSSGSSSGSPFLKKYGVYISWIQLALHFLVLLCVLTYALPLLGAEQQGPSFSRMLLLTLVAQGIYLLRQYGRPQWSSEYARVLFLDEQSHFLFLAVVLLNAPPSFLLLAPFALRSALFVAGGIKQLLPRRSPALWARISGPVEKLVARYSDLYALNATLEILAGFMALLQLLTPARNLMLLFGLGQYLRVRYMLSADSKRAWSGVRQRTDGWASHRMVPPLLRKGYDKVVSAMEFYSDQERMTQQQRQATGAGGLLSKCTIM